MNENILFFDLETSGHHLEYFYHLSKNLNLINTKNVFFLVDSSFEELYNENFGERINPQIKLFHCTKLESEKLLKLSGLQKYLFQ